MKSRLVQLSLSHGAFGNLQHLQRALGSEQLPLGLGTRDYSNVEVFAPRYVRIKDVSLDRRVGKFMATLEAPSERDRANAVTYLSHEAMERPQGFASATFQRTDSPGTFQVTGLVPPLPGQFELNLVVAGETIQSKRFGLPGLPTALHSLLDVDWQWLTQLLEDARERKGSDGFEHYVVSLLQLCGVPAVHYGFRSRDHFPDLVGTLKDRIVIVGECKVISPTTDAIEHIHGTARSLQLGLTGRDTLSVWPVFFTARAHSEINETAVARARTLGVVIVTRDALTACCTLLREGAAQSVALASLFHNGSQPGIASMNS